MPSDCVRSAHPYVEGMRILIATDRSEYGPIVIEHGLDQAVRTGADDLHFVTVVPNEHELAGGAAWLQATARELCDVFDCTSRKATFHVLTDIAPIAIAKLARELRPVLLVIGRFGVPSHADVILETVDVPTLVVGPEGHDLEPQCPDCGRIRKWTNAERLFCDRHAGDKLPDLVMRLPTSHYVAGTGLW
jgi:nucleotide-binding universal stress UspA family protein